MSTADEPEAARRDKSEGCRSVVRSSPQNRTPSDKAQLGGEICRFELVRGRGDAEVTRLAELQHGHIHLYQLRAAGIGKNALAHRLRTGRLHATLPCVFLVGRPQRDLAGRMMAAALYCRGGGLVAGRSAAHGWGLLDTTQEPSRDEPIEVLLVGRNGKRTRGIVVHRTSSLARQDIRWRKGIPVTSPARTILDLAGTMEELELEAVLSMSVSQNLVRLPQLRDVMERNPHAKGIGQLRALLEQSESLHDTRSKYEHRFLKLLKAAELPLPITNTWIAGKFIDGIWPDLKLVLEIDGFKDHGKRHKFESDRVRDQHLMIVGHHVIRVTARQIDHAPYALVARCASVITTLRAQIGWGASAAG